MGREHKRSSKRHQSPGRAGRKLADPLTSNPQSRYGTIDNYGLRAEVLYVSKLGCVKIIPTAEKKILKRMKRLDP